MYARQITSEETHTLLEAKRIINAERKAKMGSLLYKAKQKLLGVVALLTVLQFLAVCNPCFLAMSPQRLLG